MMLLYAETVKYCGDVHCNEKGSFEIIWSNICNILYISNSAQDNDS